MNYQNNNYQQPQQQQNGYQPMACKYCGKPITFLMVQTNNGPRRFPFDAEPVRYVTNTGTMVPDQNGKPSKLFRTVVFWKEHRASCTGQQQPAQQAPQSPQWQQPPQQAAAMPTVQQTNMQMNQNPPPHGDEDLPF